MSEDDRTALLVELSTLLRKWDEGQDLFADIVRCSADLMPAGDREIADEFQVAASTVKRWMTKTAIPHPRLQKIVVEHLRGKIRPPTNDAS